MTHSEEPEKSDEEAHEDRESGEIMGILSRALAEPPAPSGSLLPKIQDRIYQRTRGRYFRPRRGGFSSSITLSLIVALTVAVLLVGAYLIVSAQLP